MGDWYMQNICSDVFYIETFSAALWVHHVVFLEWIITFSTNRGDSIQNGFCLMFIRSLLLTWSAQTE